MTIVYKITKARGTATPDLKASSKALKRSYQWVRYYSRQLAFLTDFSMITLGGSLKKRERLSARLGDMLSTLYLTSAVLRNFYQAGEPEEELLIVLSCCQQLLYESETAKRAFLDNYPIRWARIFLKLCCNSWRRHHKKINDKTAKALVEAFVCPSKMRSRLTRFVFHEKSDFCPLADVEDAFHKIIAVQFLEKKIGGLVKSGQITALTLLEQIEEAHGLKLITQAEANQLINAESARQRVIAVDDFDEVSLLSKK